MAKKTITVRAVETVGGEVEIPSGDVLRMESHVNNPQHTDSLVRGAEALFKLVPSLTSMTVEATEELNIIIRVKEIA